MNHICKKCGKEYYVRPSDERLGRRVQYCSTACAQQAKKKRLDKVCLQCGKPFEVQAKSQKQRPCNFCSIQCSRQHAKETTDKYLDKMNFIGLYQSGKTLAEVGELCQSNAMTIRRRLIERGIPLRPTHAHAKGAGNVMYGKTHTPEAIAKIREANRRQFSKPSERERQAQVAAKLIAEGRTGKQFNKLEQAFANLLTEMGIAYTWGHRLGRYVFDFYIPHKLLLIECDGSFWHADPRFFDRSSLHKVQVTNLENDRKKDAFAQERGFSLIRFWEHDIHHSPDLIKARLAELLQQ